MQWNSQTVQTEVKIALDAKHQVTACGFLPHRLNADRLLANLFLPSVTAPALDGVSELAAAAPSYSAKPVLTPYNNDKPGAWT